MMSNEIWICFYFGLKKRKSYWQGKKDFQGWEYKQTVQKFQLNCVYRALKEQFIYYLSEYMHTKIYRHNSDDKQTQF